MLVGDDLIRNLENTTTEQIRTRTRTEQNKIKNKNTIKNRAEQQIDKLRSVIESKEVGLVIDWRRLNQLTAIRPSWPLFCSSLTSLTPSLDHVAAASSLLIIDLCFGACWLRFVWLVHFGLRPVFLLPPPDETTTSFLAV